MARKSPLLPPLACFLVVSGEVSADSDPNLATCLALAANERHQPTPHLLDRLSTPEIAAPKQRGQGRRQHGESRQRVAGSRRVRVRGRCGCCGGGGRCRRVAGLRGVWVRGRGGVFGVAGWVGRVVVRAGAGSWYSGYTLALKVPAMPCMIIPRMAILRVWNRRAG